VTWNFLSSASVHQRIGGAGLFQAALSKMADDHAGQQCDERRQPETAAAPAGRPAASEEIAAAITYLAGNHASFVHGAILDLDGGPQRNLQVIVPSSGAIMVTTAIATGARPRPGSAPSLR
jgi:hypothetical protein